MNKNIFFKKLHLLWAILIIAPIFTYGQDNITVEDILPKERCEDWDNIVKTFHKKKPDGRGNDKAIGLIENTIKGYIKLEPDTYKQAYEILVTDVKANLLTNNRTEEDIAILIQLLNSIDVQEDSELWNGVKLEVACEVARYLHQDYIDNPEKLKPGLPNHYTFYTSPPKKEDSTEAPEKEEETPNETSEDDNERPLYDREENDKEPNQENPKKSSKQRRGIGFGGVLLLNLILLGLYWFLVEKLKVLKSDKNKIDQNNTILNGTIKSIKEEIKNLQEEIVSIKLSNNQVSDRIQSNIVYLDNKLKKVEKSIEELDNEGTRNSYNDNADMTWNKEDISKVKSSSNKIRYSAPPNELGYFDTSRFQKQIMKGRSLYELYIDSESDTEATFNIITTPEILDYFASTIDKSIKPACEIRGEGSLKNNIDSVVTTPGKIRKEGNQWKVVDKIVITY